MRDNVACSSLIDRRATLLILLTLARTHAALTRASPVAHSLAYRRARIRRHWHRQHRRDQSLTGAAHEGVHRVDEAVVGRLPNRR